MWCDHVIIRAEVQVRFALFPPLLAFAQNNLFLRIAEQRVFRARLSLGNMRATRGIRRWDGHGAILQGPRGKRYGRIPRLYAQQGGKNFLFIMHFRV